jgi:hypothetical protein
MSLLRKGILLMGFEIKSETGKGFRSKALPPDRLFRVGA